MSTATPRVSHILSTTYDDTEKYTNLYHPDYIPGTINLLLSKVDDVDLGGIEKVMTGKAKTLKTTENGIILHPQPTESPNDPLNWGRWKKFYQFCLLAFITGFTAATSNDAGSVQDSMNEIYDISYDSMNTGAGVLFASIGLTTVILAPTSSLYGRKISYIICITMGLIGAAWFGAAKRTSDTIWSQLFVGSSEACAEATVQLSISDMYFSHQLSGALTIYILATSVGTYLGPLIAGFIVSDNFRWVGYTGAVMSAVLLIVIFVTMYETYFDRKKYNYSIDGERPTEIDETIVPVDKEKTDSTLQVRQSNGSTSNDNSVVQNEQLPCRDNGASDKPKTFLQNIAFITPSATLVGWGIKQYFQRLFLMLRVFWFPPVVYSGILWGLQDAFLTFYLTTEDDQYYDPPWSYSDTGVAIMNVPCVIGAALGCLYAGYFSDTFVIWLAKRRGGIQEAEDYLWFLFALIIICPVGLIIFAVGTDHTWSWKITYTVGLGFIGFSFGCAGDIAMAYLMAAYPEMVLEGMVGVAFINNAIGCIFTFACSPWLDAMGNTNTYIILAALQVAAVLLNIPFLLYGKQIRIWTKKHYIEYIELRDGKNYSDNH